MNYANHDKNNKNLFTYIKRPKDSSAKYDQNKERLPKKLVFLEKKKKKATLWL